MISNEQIAHDLALSKLSGSNLSSKELVSLYRKYYDEILSILNSEPARNNTASIVSPQF